MMSRSWITEALRRRRYLLLIRSAEGGPVNRERLRALRPAAPDAPAEGDGRG